MEMTPNQEREAIAQLQHRIERLKYVVNQYSRHDEDCMVFVSKGCSCGYQTAMENVRAG